MVTFRSHPITLLETVPAKTHPEVHLRPCCRVYVGISSQSTTYSLLNHAGLYLCDLLRDLDQPPAIQRLSHGSPHSLLQSPPLVVLTLYDVTSLSVYWVICFSIV